MWSWRILTCLTIFVFIFLFGFSLHPLNYSPGSSIIAVGSVAFSRNAELPSLKTVASSDAIVFIFKGPTDVPRLEFDKEIWMFYSVFS